MTTTPLYLVPEAKWEHHTLAACVDCLVFVANGDEPDSADSKWSPAKIQARWPAREGWGLVTGDTDQDDEFSWQPCECCGSTLGGSRHQLVAMRSVKP